jgi:hypothetical protein
MVVTTTILAISEKNCYYLAKKNYLVIMLSFGKKNELVFRFSRIFEFYKKIGCK